MDEDNDLEGAKAKADVMNERGGHASVFARKTPEDLQIVERAAACEFSESVQAKYGLQIDNIESNPEKNGVPDCFANHEGRRIGIELTELVDGSLLDDIRNTSIDEPAINAYSGEGFVRAQWDEARFSKDLSERICCKVRKYQKNGHAVDILIVHTAEPWLKPERVEKWVSLSNLKPTVQIRSAYLLMDYVPGYSENWPVFRIF